MLESLSDLCNASPVGAVQFAKPGSAWTVIVPPGLAEWPGMKLKNLFPIRHRKKLVRCFGNARLVKLPNGQHELVGGSDADRAAAFEWVSLFAHEIVFTHFLRETRSSSDSSVLFRQLQSA